MNIKIIKYKSNKSTQCIKHEHKIHNQSISHNKTTTIYKTNKHNHKYT